MDCPDHLHDEHNCYPLACEKMAPRDGQLAPCTLQQMAELQGGRRSKTEKLVAHLGSRKKYVVAIENLQFYLRQGMVLKKVHRAIEYTQKPWMRDYIDHNTAMRNQAKREGNAVLTDFFKAANTNVFGKTMENTREYSCVRFATTMRDFTGYVNVPNFKEGKFVNDQVATMHIRKTEVKLDKPIYAGQKILDLSKMLMYDFHYNVIRKKYGASARLLFTDTDSLCYVINTDDIFDDMAELQQHFDFMKIKRSMPGGRLAGTFPEGHGVVGLMKPEMDGDIITEMVLLKPKMYALQRLVAMKEGRAAVAAVEAARSHPDPSTMSAADLKLRLDPDAMSKAQSQLRKAEQVKAKGFKSSLTTFEVYKNSLFHNQLEYVEDTNIRSKNHVVHTKTTRRVGPSPVLGDKRYEIKDSHNTLALGHWRSRIEGS